MAHVKLQLNCTHSDCERLAERKRQNKRADGERGRERRGQVWSKTHHQQIKQKEKKNQR